MTSVEGTRVTVTTTQAFTTLNSLRGYLLRVTSGNAGGESWRIWGNTVSTALGGGLCSTVITIQGEIETSPAAGSAAYINGYTPPIATGVLQGTVAAIVDTKTIDVAGVSLPTANGGLSGATVRIFIGDDDRVPHDRLEHRDAGSRSTPTGRSPSARSSRSSTSSASSPPRCSRSSPTTTRPACSSRQTDGSTRVSESGIVDSYTVVLTADPGAQTITVTMRSLATETSTRPRATPATGTSRRCG